MSFKGYIRVWKVLAAGASGSGISLGLVGVIESQYYSPGSFATLMFGFGLYALAGIVWGVLVALLFGGKARSNREDLVRMAGRIAAVPTAGLVLTAGFFLVFRDIWNESADQADLVGWLLMLAVPVLALAGAWFARVLGRSLAVSPLVAPVLVLPLALAGALLAGWVDEQPAQSLDLSGRAANESRPEVILVLADGMLTDEKAPDPETSNTPNLDAFAEDAVVFEQAESTHRLSESLPTLAGLLKQNGYATLASVSNQNPETKSGPGRGFDAYAGLAPEQVYGIPNNAGRLVLVEIYRSMCQRLDSGHQQEPGTRAEGERILQQGRELISQSAEASVPFFVYLHFRQEIRIWDGLFGELSVFLKEAGCYDNSLIIVTSGHGASVVPEPIPVPLLIRFPGGAGAGTVQAKPVSLSDVLPTILQTLGIQAPDLPGQSLTALADPDTSE